MNLLLALIIGIGALLWQPNMLGLVLFLLLGMALSTRVSVSLREQLSTVADLSSIYSALKIRKVSQQLEKHIHDEDQNTWRI